MKFRILNRLLLSSLLAMPLAAIAEDTDLFLNQRPEGSTDQPNVLFIIDNTANWSPHFENEMLALKNTFNNLPNDKFRVGMMLFTETGGGNNNVAGGYVRAAIRLMTGGNNGTKQKYASLINSFNSNGDKGNGGQTGLAMMEAYRYFAGGAPHAGNGKAKTDYTGNVLTGTANAASNAVYALPGNALTEKDSNRYLSPASGCQKNFIIYISNGSAQVNNNANTIARAALELAGGDTTPIPLSPSGSQDDMGDEWARFMEKSALGIVTYTIDVNPKSTGQGPGWSRLLQSMAGDKPGRYFKVRGEGSDLAEQLEKVLSTTLSEIQAVNSVFSSVSLPVSVNTQGTYLNQVYIGMFRPDPQAKPRWAGNLKQYKLAKIDGVLQMVDADEKSAINSQTGFITECSRSFWTPTTADRYWAFLETPQGECIPPSSQGPDYYKVSNFPDGNIVEKGAQAYMLRSTTTRRVNTCSLTSCTALTSFDTSNNDISQSALGVASASDRDNLINWARGVDIEDENQNGNKTEMRPSAHGDVVHSHPVAINYGTDEEPKVVVFYGANDGMLRAINGNRSTDIVEGGLTVPAGAELWSFVAPESYSMFKRIRQNTTKISAPTITGLPKQYGIDGPITAYKDSTRAWIFATMRRGGRALYAFDVTTPTAPTLKWKKGCPSNFPSSGTVSDVGCSSEDAGNFNGIGQTWSAARTLKAAGYRADPERAGTEKPLIIIGGGYDLCEDSDPHSCTSDSKGNKIYVLDADTGTLLKSFDTSRGVVADITIVPDRDGLARYAYAADLGGNLYRIDIGGAAPGSWTNTKIASLGCDTVASCDANRKFMFAPDVVEEDGIFYVLVGSGDREKPLQSYTSAYGVTNYFFMVQDKPSDSHWLTSETSNCSDTAVICKDSLLGILTDATPAADSLAAKKGWYLGLAPHEQVVTAGITLDGVVTFSTHQPAVPVVGACGSDLGIANVYNIGYLDAAGVNGVRFQRIAGDGLPPSPKAGVVRLDDGTTERFVIGSTRDSPLQVGPGNAGSPGSSAHPKSRVYWYIEQ